MKFFKWFYKSLKKKQNSSDILLTIKNNSLETDNYCTKEYSRHYYIFVINRFMYLEFFAYLKYLNLYFIS